MEVVVRRLMIDRKIIPMAKVRLRLENGIKMTIIDWDIAQGLTLLLLGLFIRATTCDRSRCLSKPQIRPKGHRTLIIRPQTYDADKMLPPRNFCIGPNFFPDNNSCLNIFTSDKIMAPAAIAPRIAHGNLPASVFSSPT